MLAAVAGLAEGAGASSPGMDSSATTVLLPAAKVVTNAMSVSKQNEV
jgi:hypothetical protein